MAKKSDRLQIKVLSDHGSVISQVNCPRGSITVLRGYKQSDLEPFKRSFAGIPGPERIVITIEETPYERGENTLIGFGESDWDPEQLVSKYLEQFMNTSAIEPLLFSYGLDTAAEKSLSSLSPDEKRRLKLLTAPYNPSKAIILNLPFEPISSTWIEKYAAYLVEQCQAHNKIIVITNLGHRPECWIDNPNILRVQLGEEVSKTIGFGTDASGVQSMIEDIRKSIKEGEKLGDAVDRIQKESQPIPANIKKKLEDRDRKTTDEISPDQINPLVDPAVITKWLKPVAAAAFALLITLVYFTTLKVSKDKETPIKTAALTPQAGTTPKQTPDKSAAQPKQTPVKLVKQTKTPSKPPITKSSHVVDLYPPEIKKSLLLALDSPNPPYIIKKASVKKPSSSVNNQASDLLSALQGLSGSGDHLPDQKVSRIKPKNYGSLNTSSSASVADREKRREVIRQKFLEAIKKASAS